MISTTSNKREDDYLLESIKSDNKKSFERLFSKYYSILCTYITPMVGFDDAEEIIQDMMVNIWENRKAIRIESSFRSYIFKSAKNRCINFLEKNNTHESIHSIIAEKLSIQFEEPDFYIVEELSKRMNEAINNLPESYRDTFIKNRIYKKTYNEIAREYGVSPKTIDYRIQKAIKILRDELKDYI